MVFCPQFFCLKSAGPMFCWEPFSALLILMPPCKTWGGPRLLLPCPDTHRGERHCQIQANVASHGEMCGAVWGWAATERRKEQWNYLSGQTALVSSLADMSPPGKLKWHSWWGFQTHCVVLSQGTEHKVIVFSQGNCVIVLST